MNDEQGRRHRFDRRRMPLAGGAVVVLMLASGTAWQLGAFEQDSAQPPAGHGASATPEPGLMPTKAPVSGDLYVLLNERRLQVPVAVGGGCHPTGHATAAVDEHDGTVQITPAVAYPPQTSPPPAVCTAHLILQNVDVQLTRDLADRTVIDAVSQRPLRRAPGDGPGVRAPRATKLSRTDEFGIVTALRGAGADLQISVDRVDMLDGAVAEAAARAAGEEVAGDYYLRNDNPLTRTYRVAPDAVVWGSIQMRMPEPWPRPTTLARWREFVTSHLGQGPPFHFMVENGVVTGIEEQYLP